MNRHLKFSVMTAGALGPLLALDYLLALAGEPRAVWLFRLLGLL